MAIYIQCPHCEGEGLIDDDDSWLVDNDNFDLGEGNYCPTCFGDGGWWVDAAQNFTSFPSKGADQ